MKVQNFYINNVMPWLHNPNMLWLRDLNIDLDLSFTYNQISNIFYFKILHALFLAFDIFYTNLDITSYTSALALSKEEVFCVLWNQSLAACLIASLQEKTIYRSVPFLSGSSGARDVS